MKLTKYNLQFYYDWKLKPNSSNYNILIDRKLSGSIDINRLKTALNNFVAENLILNSHIELDSNSQPCWKPNLNVEFIESKTEESQNDIEYKSCQLFAEV